MPGHPAFSESTFANSCDRTTSSRFLRVPQPWSLNGLSLLGIQNFLHQNEDNTRPKYDAQIDRVI